MHFELIWELIWISCLSVLFVCAEPLILLKRYLGFKQEEVSYNRLKSLFTKLLYCAMCSSWYISLVILFILHPHEVLFNFEKSFMISILSELIYRKLMS